MTPKHVNLSHSEPLIKRDKWGFGSPSQHRVCQFPSKMLYGVRVCKFHLVILTYPLTSMRYQGILWRFSAILRDINQQLWAMWYGLFAILSLFLGVTPSAQATSTDWVSHPEASIRLITDHSSVAAGSTIWAALEIAPTPTWKTYWRSPGPAGAGPEIIWSPTTAAQIGAIQYPWPEVFVSAGFVSIGYQSRVILPFQVTVPATGTALTLDGKVYYQVCQEICVPLEADLSLTLPMNSAKGAAETRQAIQNALLDVPTMEKETLFNSQAWVEGNTVVLQLTHTDPLQHAAALIEGPYGIAAPADEVFVSEDRLGARFIFDFGRGAKRLKNKPAQVILSAGLNRVEYPVMVRTGP